MSAGLQSHEVAPMDFPEGFATSEQYGGPLQAALAMQLSMSGVVRQLPDNHYTNAFSRRLRSDNPDDLDTVLGAACSYSDGGCEVLVLGTSKQLAQTPQWEELLRGRYQASVERRLPTAARIRRLLADNWAVVLHAAGSAFDSDTVPVHPVLITGYQNRSLLVHNPGSDTMEPMPHQQILANRALGRTNYEQRKRVSLLAVRFPDGSAASTTVRKLPLPDLSALQT